MGRYDGMRERILGAAASDPNRGADQWDPFAVPYPATVEYPLMDPLYMSDVNCETPYERKLRMLRPLKDACWACTMCDLGRKHAAKDYMDRDPHCFSNMNPTQYMVVGQNPGWNELAEGTPFVGPAGANFDAELARHGVDRKKFYICNTVRCWTKDNAKPEERHRKRCEPFLAMEIGLIRPKFVVALGAFAFESLCDGDFTARLGEITESQRYGVRVFAVYHPSPRNLEDAGRASAFRHQMRLLCGLVKAVDKK